WLIELLPRLRIRHCGQKKYLLSEDSVHVERARAEDPGIDTRVRTQENWREPERGLPLARSNVVLDLFDVTLECNRVAAEGASTNSDPVADLRAESHRPDGRICRGADGDPGQPHARLCVVLQHPLGLGLALRDSEHTGRLVQRAHE